MTTPTPEEMMQQIAANTQSIEQLTSAVNMLVTQFIRPNSQQAFANFERLERIEGVIETMATRMVTIVDLIQAFDERLEETRSLVAENASRIAQIDTKLDRAAALIEANGQQIEASRAETEARIEASRAETEARIEASRAETEARIEASKAETEAFIEASRAETEALKELVRSQLSGIIANGRRIDRLEQQAG